MGAVAPWTVLRESIVANAVRRLSFRDAIALQVRGPVFVPGLELRFVEDVVGDASMTWHLDAPGSLVPWGGAGIADLVFPTDIPESAADVGYVELIAYHANAVDVLPAIASNAAARQYPETQVLVIGQNVAVPNGLGLTLFESSGPTREEGDISQRRFNVVSVWVHWRMSDPAIANSDISIQFETLLGGVWIAIYSVAGGRNQVWQNTQSGTPGRIGSFHWPTPMTPWRVRLGNVDPLVDATASFLVQQSTAPLARYIV